MKAAGYDVDLDKYIAMKIQDVTAEYARSMSQLGFGKLSADDLIACKIQGVTSEYIAGLKQNGLEVKDIQDAISYRIFEVTPEFVAGMKAAGYGGLSSQELSPCAFKASRRNTPAPLPSSSQGPPPTTW
jgi:hypothetical protein